MDKWCDRGIIAVVFVLIAIILGALLSGCSFIDTGQIIDEVVEAIDETPAPGETPTPTPTPVETVSMPEYLCAQANSTLPVGICIATENYVPGGRDKGSSISVITLKAASHMNPLKKVSKEYYQLTLDSPKDKRPDCLNWNLSAGHGYTTRHATNPDTGVVTPADGTWRGIAILELQKYGYYDIYVKSKLTENRGTAYIGVTVQDAGGVKTTYWHKWYQNVKESKKTEVCVGKKVQFLPREK